MYVRGVQNLYGKEGSQAGIESCFVSQSTAMLPVKRSKMATIETIKNTSTLIPMNRFNLLPEWNILNHNSENIDLFIKNRRDVLYPTF